MITPYSQNGWPTFADYGAAGLRDLSWITGQVAGGDVWTVLDWLCRRFNAEVEPIVKASSWGFAPRAIIGSTTTSNHASGTAIDLNADAHPLAAMGTFNWSQQVAIQRILADATIDGVPVLRWGGNYPGRKDEMHFELNLQSNGNSPALVAKLATKITAPVAPLSTTAPALPLLRKGTDGGPAAARLKGWLHAMYSYGARTDGSNGWLGDDAWTALQTFARRVGLLGATETLDAWGPKCWAAARVEGFRG